MMDYPQPAQPIRPANISRVNWKQTTTFTLAAFVACLVALVAAAFVYKYMLGKKVQQDTAKLSKLQQEVEHQQQLLADVKAGRPAVNPKTKPASSAVPSKTANNDEAAQQSDDESETQTAEPTGTRVETTPAV
jgi:H+/gluconate symporter-like permease